MLKGYHNYYEAIITLTESENARLASEHSIVSFRFCSSVLEPSDYLKEREEKQSG